MKHLAQRSTANTAWGARGLAEDIVGIKRRMHLLFGGLAVLFAAVYLRLMAMELSAGDEYRAVADEPIIRRTVQPALRGQIVSADGVVLAYDQPTVTLAVGYRWLEEPANRGWLRRMALARLPAGDRRSRVRIEREQQKILAQRQQLAEKLRKLCGMSESQWRRRRDRIQQRVQTIADLVNARHGIGQQRSFTNEQEDNTRTGVAKIAATIKQSLVDALFSTDQPPPAPRITVLEEVSEHAMYEGLSLEAVAEIEAHRDRYPGVKLVHEYRRAYPQKGLAAHCLGYLGVASRPFPSGALLARLPAMPFRSAPHKAEHRVGMTGVEQQYEQMLRGRHGIVVEHIDRRGTINKSTLIVGSADGCDLKLTLDTRVQRAAEMLLDEALARRLPTCEATRDEIGGGAILVMDVHTGAIVAAASAPRFDPNALAAGSAQRVRQWLGSPAKPFFNRCIQMALPPGSVFKIVTAAAILDAKIDPQSPVDCQGYLHQPEALRCAIFRRLGIGHGAVSLSDALARSCNVYFFHYAEQIGAEPLLAWARKFGFERRTGVDLPSESAGNLPHLASAPTNAVLHHGPPDPRHIAIGQSTIIATPLQVARMIAAIANGGHLVQPYIADGQVAARRYAIPGLDAGSLAEIRRGLHQAVASEHGTAYEALSVLEAAIEGKTGTAQSGPNRGDHAWFAGYAPAKRPQLAIVVVLEHAGDASTTAAVVTKHLVKKLDALGYFDSES